MSKMLLLVLPLFLLTACTEADRVSNNLSQEADSFNITRRLTVINAIQGETLFEITGRMSIYDDGQQLEIVTLSGEDDYKKHFVGLSDNVTYVIEDVTGTGVNADQYTIKFNPKSVLPDVEIVD